MLYNNSVCVCVCVCVSGAHSITSHFLDSCEYSVGFPYKEAVVEFCDEVHPLAKVGLIHHS